MLDNTFAYFLTAVILFSAGKSIYYFIEKDKILKDCRALNSIEFKNITGALFTDEGTFKKKYEWCSFDLLINENSIFLFITGFSFIPFKVTNLLFSNSNKKNTRKPTLLREYKIDSGKIHLVYYPEHLLARSRTITLENLNAEQITIFENVLDGKSRRFY